MIRPNHCYKVPDTEAAIKSEAAIKTEAVIKSEAAIKKQILTYLKTQGFFFPVTDRFLHGTADIIGCHKGRFVAIEVKREGKIPTKIQAWFLRQVYQAGGKGIVARNVEDVRRHIE